MKHYLTFLLMALVAAIAASVPLACSQKQEAINEQRTPGPAAEDTNRHGDNEEEEEVRPESEDIGEDCVAFLRSTRTAEAPPPNDQCPQCPKPDTSHDVLKFETYHEDKVACSGGTCEVSVTIQATFHPSRGGSIAGGLTGWISPEQKEQYARGQTPEGRQIYRVKISYRRDQEGGWQPVEFDCAEK